MEMLIWLPSEATRIDCAADVNRSESLAISARSKPRSARALALSKPKPRLPPVMMARGRVSAACMGQLSQKMDTAASREREETVLNLALVVWDMPFICGAWSR